MANHSTYFHFKCFIFFWLFNTPTLVRSGEFPFMGPFFRFPHVIFHFLPASVESFPSHARLYPPLMKWIEKYFNSRFSLWSFPLLWFMAQLKMLWLNLVLNRIFHWLFSSASSFFNNITMCSERKRIFFGKQASNNDDDDDDDELKRERY